MKDYKIVLTADRSFMSDYHSLPFLRGLRFASTRILNPSIFFRFVGPRVPRTGEGLALLAPYHTRRTEAALLNSGFDESQVAVVTPDNVCSFIRPCTKIISITVRDPLSKIHHYSFLNPLRRESYSSFSFKKLVGNLCRKKRNFRVVVEGPGAWQLTSPEDRGKFGIDHVVVGEHVTDIIPDLFGKVIEDEQAPEVLYATPSGLSDVPIVRGGVTEGLVEVARGCNRHCRFCTVPRLQCRAPRDIVAEARVNVQYGQHNITLRSDDILHYMAEGVKVNRKAVLGLYGSVSKVNGVKRVGQCYLNLASAMSEPSLIKEISGIIGVGCKEYPYTTALVGIESGSSRLVKTYMPGKASPFKPLEWAEVVEQGFGICNESHWVPLGMLILGLPGENEDDVNETITLVEKLRAYRSILIPFAFEAKGMLSQKDSFRIGNLERCHLELVKKVFRHNTLWGKRLIKEQARSLSMPRWLLPFVSPLIDWGVKRACEKLLGEIVGSTSSSLLNNSLY